MSELQQKQQQIKSNENNRPQLLTVLVILSLMTIANGLFSNILGLLAGPLPASEVEKLIDSYMPQVENIYDLGQYYWGDMAMKIIHMIKYTNANFLMDRLINISAYSIGLFGVLNMLKGVKLGFHLYIIYNLIALFGVYASVPISEIPGFYFAFYGAISVLFIYLYSKALPWMSK